MGLFGKSSRGAVAERPVDDATRHDSEEILSKLNQLHETLLQVKTHLNSLEVPRGLSYAVTFSTQLEGRIRTSKPFSETVILEEALHLKKAIREFEHAMQAKYFSTTHQLKDQFHVAIENRYNRLLDHLRHVFDDHGLPKIPLKNI